MNKDIAVYERVIKSSSLDYAKYRKYFLDITPEIVAHTFKASIQYAHAGWISGNITQTHDAPFPASNVFRRNESVTVPPVHSFMMA